MNDIYQKYNNFLTDYNNLKGDVSSLGATIQSYTTEVNKLKATKTLNDEATQCMKAVLPVITSTSTGNFIEICSKVLSSVFDRPVEVRFDANDISIVSPEGVSSLKSANGGGYKMVVSFIASIFMILKANSRRFIVFDEAFTQLDDTALERFMQVVRGFCAQLGFDILLVTHDPRISTDWTDTNLLIMDGAVKNVKSL
jgi:DNA repair exonuclease SbcCD ATPase subunit